MFEFRDLFQWDRFITPTIIKTFYWLVIALISLFGISGIFSQQAPIGTHPQHVISSSSATGLEFSFLIMLVTLGAAGSFMARARHTYAGDVAAAAAASQPTGPAEPGPTA